MIRTISISIFLLLINITHSIAIEDTQTPKQLNESPSIYQINSTDSEERYLIALAEKNITWVNTLTSIFSWGLALATVAFFSILIFILNELRKIHQERNLNEKAISDIANLKRQITDMALEIKNQKNMIRDESLRSRSMIITDDEYADIVKKYLGKEPKSLVINRVKDFIWHQEITLDDIKNAVRDIELLNKIRAKYRDSFPNKEEIPADELIQWAYFIYNNKKTMEQLIEEEKESIRIYESFISNPLSALGFSLRF